MQFHWRHFGLTRFDLARCRQTGELCAALAIPLCAAVAIFFLVSVAFNIGPKLGAPSYAQAAVWGR